VAARARPEDRVFHYYDFFHDFTFYAGRLAGTVEFHGDELEFGTTRRPAPVAASSPKPNSTASGVDPAGFFLLVRKKKIEEVRADYARAQAGWKQSKEPAPAPPHVPVFADTSFSISFARRVARALSLQQPTLICLRPPPPLLQ